MINGETGDISNAFAQPDVQLAESGAQNDDDKPLIFFEESVGGANSPKGEASGRTEAEMEETSEPLISTSASSSSAQEMELGGAEQPVMQTGGAGGEGGSANEPVASDNESGMIVDGAKERDFSVRSLVKKEFWMYYFDVDTVDVWRRVAKGLCCFRPLVYNEATITKPDLYGPVWITTTLILFVGIFSNVALWADGVFGKDGGKQFSWNFLTICAGAFYGFMVLVPLGLGLLCHFFRKTKIGQGCANIVSVEALPFFRLLMTIEAIYGYSLTPLFASLALAPIPVKAVRWTMIGLGLAYSYVTTTVNLKPIADCCLPLNWIFVNWIALFVLHSILFVPLFFCLHH
ncbi:putative protein YIPF1/2 [Monocercomonoides exilis]|uniref:putative protein YIPF1/2 n=1 Tax=Monocercomonoides exilis TaxID=2049356 RepID=UPI003559DD72|nr:putative protein YIPF1/2 [Monocercomonoides exilis]|eukprot:MONOS_5919.1-p1 / transcript=MONOS_5919.1 / gene=MONOS_5919 / organism=Monocercomonoides_exilis_PA203 / gene_product=unspecified product / transcript_product=unspecified product / location=Mono_scaffold00178:84368-86606(-) / protein_length=346 / sequence_SO=supercontig / SO=protein_coding / is_pseudo=false